MSCLSCLSFKNNSDVRRRDVSLNFAQDYITRYKIIFFNFSLIEVESKKIFIYRIVRQKEGYTVIFILGIIYDSHVMHNFYFVFILN